MIYTDNALFIEWFPKFIRDYAENMAQASNGIVEMFELDNYHSDCV